MAGTHEGWLKSRQTMIKRMGSEEALRQHFQKIGALGGRNGTTGGFAHQAKQPCSCNGGHVNRAACLASVGGKNRTGWRKHV